MLKLNNLSGSPRTVYIFNVLDTYSEFVINLGNSLFFVEDTIISHIKKLLKHKDFKRPQKKPFTLVCDIDKDFGQRVRAILLAENGKLVIDSVQQNTKSFSDFFNKKGHKKTTPKGGSQFSVAFNWIYV